MKYISYIALTILFFFSACHPNCPNEKFEQLVDTFKYGKKYNNERMKRGIPILTEQWVTKDGLHWYYKNKDSYNTLNINNCDRHVYKEINIQAGNIKSEKDFYIGHRKGLFWFGNSISCKFENIKITYYYDMEYKSCYPWVIGGDILDRQRLPSSIWKADSILREWGIARLNYIPTGSMPFYKKYEKYILVWQIMSEDLND